jgi:uncharacterized OB-fold protein
MAISVDDRCLRLTDDNGEQGVLLGMRCPQCGVCVFGPATFCQSCTAPDLEEIELTPDGTLFSYTIVRVPPPGWPGPVPYVLGEVELPEGPHVLAEVVDCPHQQLQVGMPVSLALRAVEMEGVANSERVVYKWRPA